MIQAQTERSPFAQDLCRCGRCGGLLSRYDIVFDDLGRTVERCPKCGPALLVLRRGAPVVRAHHVLHAKPAGKCVDCRRPLIWKGAGSYPVRCARCQKERGRVRDLEYYHAKHERELKAISQGKEGLDYRLEEQHHRI